MIPLFSNKIRAKLSVVLISIFLFGFSQFEQISSDPFETICKNSDAYLLHSYTDVTYTYNFFGYKRYVTYDTKMVINTTNGVDEFAFLNLDEYTSNHLENIKVRTLKADGSIVELDSSLVFQRESSKNKFGPIHYPIPGVEPGDTIEASYMYYEKLKKNELMAYVNLNSDLPSVNSQYTIRTSPDFDVRYKPYNNFPKPTIVANDTLVYLQFSMNEIDGLKTNDNHCILCEKPYLYYSLEDNIDELRTWKDVYNEEFNFLTQPMAIDREKSSYYKKWKRDIIGEAIDSSKYFKLKLLHTEVVQNFAMEPPKKGEFIKSTGYFLKNKRFDPINIRRFYRKILEDLEIDYWAVFGRTKQNGKIDKYLIRKGEFDHVFFAYKDENDSFRFLYPHDEYLQFQIDEIPTSLYNTEAIIVQPHFSEKIKKRDKVISKDLKLAKTDSVSVAEILLPGMDANQNYLRHVISSEIDIAKKKASLRFRYKLSGGLSTELRSFFSLLGQDEEASNYFEALEEFEGIDNTIQIDTITTRMQDSKRPFSLNVSGEGSLNEVITYVKDSIISVSLEKLINHSQLEHIDNYDKLNYYLSYSYSDQLLVYLNFPSKIEVLGLENTRINYSESFAEYNFNVEKNNENQLQIKSEYKILSDFIPKSELNKLKEINDLVKKAKSTRLIVKLRSD